MLDNFRYLLLEFLMWKVKKDLKGWDGTLI